MPKAAQLQSGRAEAALELPGLNTVLLRAVLSPWATRTALGPDRNHPPGVQVGELV